MFGDGTGGGPGGGAQLARVEHVPGVEHVGGGQPQVQGDHGGRHLVLVRVVDSNARTPGQGGYESEYLT